ncbi:MAG TPA: molybdate ABC transporter substrate-binding protein [Bryobacteraceae bacterium]|nr:molybdate ABC transporter substrate-binding protein [Bryobacteraceae bacterium]
MQKRQIAALLWFCLLCSCSRPPRSHELAIAAAADLNFALEEVSSEFAKSHPTTTLRIAYGSSGNFYAQLRSHAPFDLFVSADVEYPRKLATEGLAIADSVFVYGVGRIVVWVPAQSTLDPATAMQSAALHHLAIANPQHAPYGHAAELAMRSMGVYDSVEGKLVLGENIAQTLQFVQSGAADAGIVALSLAIAPAVRSQGRYWEIPLNAYPKMEQGGVIVKDSPEAREFRSWLLAPEGRAILKRYGFYMPGE